MIEFTPDLVGKVYQREDGKLFQINAITNGRIVTWNGSYSPAKVESAIAQLNGKEAGK